MYFISMALLMGKNCQLRVCKLDNIWIEKRKITVCFTLMCGQYFVSKYSIWGIFFENFALNGHLEYYAVL